LNEHLPLRWTGLGSPTSLAPLRRPSRSTDLTTSDILSGSIKGRVVPFRYTSNEDLSRAAEDAFRTIHPQMFRRMPQTTWRVIRTCVQHHGAHTDLLDVQPRSTSVVQINYY
jgi:hypothetical protein